MSNLPIVSIAKDLKQSLDPKLIRQLTDQWEADKQRLKLPSVKRVYKQLAPKTLLRIEGLVGSCYPGLVRVCSDNLIAVMLYLLSDLKTKKCPCCETRFFCGSYCSASCSSSHSAYSDEARAKRESTNLNRYGGTNVMHAASVKEKVLSQRDEDSIKRKREKTSIKRYGMNNVGGTVENRAKALETSLDRFGSLSAMYAVRNAASAETCRDRYGFDFAAQSDEVKQRIVKANLEKFGYAHPMQCPKFFAEHSKIGYRKRRVRFKDGSVLTIQSKDEQKVVSKLIAKGWSVRNPGISIKYELDGKSPHYHPDFLAHKGDKSVLIEVKSGYTLVSDWEMNCAKFKASNRYAKENGLTFKLCMLRKTAEAKAKLVSCTFPTRRTVLETLESL